MFGEDILKFLDNYKKQIIIVHTKKKIKKARLDRT